MLHAISDHSRDLLERKIALLDAMANAKRLHVLTVLAKCEVSVGALSEMIGLSQSALSQHLGKLRAGGIVQTRRDAQTIYYSCSTDAVRRILTMLGSFYDEELVHDRLRA